jgi:REP element-mobilizing transposase RayT
VLADSFGTRRRLPHIERAGKSYFVSFATRKREVLGELARDIVLETITNEHLVTCWLRVAVVMPDHVHIIVTPLDPWRLSKIMQRIKGTSAHRVNHAAGRHGALWEPESFDRIVRAADNLEKKSAYILANPIRAGLAEDYRWLWRE